MASLTSRRGAAGAADCAPRMPDAQVQTQVLAASRPSAVRRSVEAPVAKRAGALTAGSIAEPLSKLCGARR